MAAKRSSELRPDARLPPVSHLVALVNQLGERGVQFRSLTEALDTTTPAGRLLFHLVAAVAQFERELTVERTKAVRRTTAPSNRPCKARQSASAHRRTPVARSTCAAGIPTTSTIRCSRTRLM